MKTIIFSKNSLKFALLSNFLLFGPATYANSENRLELIKTPRAYAVYTTQVYAAGKAFPYRITVKKEISACASLKFKVTEVEGPTPSRAVLLLTSTGFTSAKVCDAPDQLIIQSFEFPAKKGFIEIIVDPNVEVVVDRIE
jgi:hypothetical protein